MARKAAYLDLLSQEDIKRIGESNYPITMFAEEFGISPDMTKNVRANYLKEHPEVKERLKEEKERDKAKLLAIQRAEYERLKADMDASYATLLENKSRPLPKCYRVLSIDQWYQEVRGKEIA